MNKTPKKTGRPRRVNKPVNPVSWTPSSQMLRDKFKEIGGRAWLESVLTDRIKYDTLIINRAMSLKNV